MDAERWARVESLYHAALERAPVERARFLDEACADDELRREVADLLAYDDPDASFMEAPALGQMAQALAAPVPDEESTSRPNDARLADTPATEGRKRVTLHPGQVVRNFRIVRLLGAGGMGQVYEADDLRLGRRVALKVLPPEANLNAQARQRFLREARAASALNHPNIVTIHAVEEADGLDFIVMEYVEGLTLQALIDRGPLPLPEVLALGVQTAAAIAEAHALGIVHRDLKPANILLARDGQPKVVDFGLAMRVPTRADTSGDAPAEGPDRLTGTGVIIGTVPYMSPEQTRGEPLDARSDVFSLGSVLYEAATGRRPFQGPSALAVMHEIAAVDPPSPSTIHPKLPRAFDLVLRRSLAKDKAQRYDSARALAAALRKLGVEAGQAKRRRARRLLAALAAAVVLAMTAGGVWYLWRQGKAVWARDQLPRLVELTQAAEYVTAYDLAAQVEQYLPHDPTLRRVMPVVSDVLSVTTEPPGARVYLKSFVRDATGQFPPRQLLGTTPIKDLRIARGEYVLAIEKEGYAPYQRTLSSALDRELTALFDESPSRRDMNLTVTPAGQWQGWLDADAPLQIDVKLTEAAQVPPRMVRVPGGKYALAGWDRPTTANVPLNDFFIDRYEVTNREYKEFISAGGYRRKELWKHPFVKDGQTIPWEQAVPELRDRTGLPGPRSWSNQNYPEGRDHHPVTDVTWYEAAAYAAFRDKQLPTVFQWEKAAREPASSILSVSVMPWGVGGPHADVEQRANFQHRGTVPVDSCEFGMSPFGCHHMAGNVAEWCLNRRPEGFTVTGGSWQDHLAIFGSFGQYPGFYSSGYLGFRCARTVGPADDDQGGMFLNERDQVPQFKPVSAERFREMLAHYRYDVTPLGAQVVEVKETDDWRREKISFAGAGGERALAYLWFPRHRPPPFALIDYKPGGASYSGLTVPQETEVVCGPFLQAGRAVFVTVLPGMSERRLPPGFADPEGTSVKFRELVVRDVIDQRRGLDYLATRPEIDPRRLAWFGLSKGGTSMVQLAVEDRYRSALILSAGLSNYMADWIPEANPVNFAPYIGHRTAGGVPKLLMHGRYDESAPLKTAAQALFGLLPEPKRMQVFDAGHFPSMELWIPVAKTWFDETLGPAAGP